MTEQERQKSTNQADTLVSIAIPCYNHEKYIIDCLNSVYNIDYSPIELLIIDDGSKDNSYELAKDWISLHQDRFSNIVIEKQNNQGLCKTLNRLNTLANGEYVAWLASDDQRTKSSIKDSLACLRSTGKNFLFSDAELIDENGLYIAGSAFAYFNKSKAALKNINYLKMDVLLRWNPPFQILFMKKDAFISLGGLDETLPFEDLALMLRLLTTNDVASCDQVTWRYRIRLNARLTPGVSLKKMQAGMLKVYQKSLIDFHGIPFGVLKLKILQMEENTRFSVKKLANLTIRLLGYLHYFRTVFYSLVDMKKLIKHFIGLFPLRLQCLLQSLCTQGRLEVPIGSYVHPSVHILGKNNIQIGVNSCISEGSWLNVNSRKNNRISIAIGSNCFIGKHNFFTSGELISIGDYTLTTVGCKFIGSSHIIDDPAIPYLLTGTTVTNKLIIGVNCFIGAGATVLGNVKVGHGSVIGADSLVLRDIPPFSIAVGNPAIVVKRYSFSKKTWLPISEISPEDGDGMPSEQDYLELLKAKFPHVNLPWIAAGRSMGNL